MKAIKFSLSMAAIGLAFISLVQMFGNRPAQVQAQRVITTNTEYQSPTFAPTQTPIPSATIDYQSTVDVAQATADEARRVNAEVTAAYQQMIQDQLQMTAEMERMNFEIQSWTMTVAATTIPLTATQQAIMNTQTVRNQNLVAGQLTATHEVPTQMAAIMRIEASAKYEKFETVARIFAFFGVGIFCVGLAVFLVRYPMPQEKPIAPNETTVTLKRDHGQGNITLKPTVVPCSPDQLTELADKITHGKKSLGINQWEGVDTLFNRQTILQVRTWLLENEFAIRSADAQLVPTPLGLDFLCGWLEAHKLPTEYQFVEDES